MARGGTLRPIASVALTFLLSICQAGCGSNPGSMPAAQNNLPAAFAALGEPKRNVTSAPRPIEQVAADAANSDAAATGVIPVMMFPSNALFVENVYRAAQNETVCREGLTSYDADLRVKYAAQYTEKVRHGLYCVAVSGGKVTGIVTVLKSP